MATKIDKKTLGILAMGGAAALFLSQRGKSEDSQIPVSKVPTQEEMARRWRQPVHFTPPGGRPVGNPNEAERNPGAPVGGSLMDVFAPVDSMFGNLATINLKEFSAPVTESMVTISQGQLAEAMENYRKEQFHKEHPRWLADVHGDFNIKSSELVGYMKRREPSVFYMKYSVEESMNYPRVKSGRLSIFIDTWDSFRHLSNLVLFSMIMVGQGQQKQVASLYAFFNYHEFYMDKNGEVYRDIMSSLNDWLCRCDERIHSIWWDIDCYPELESGPAGCDPYNFAMKKKVNAVINDGLMMLVEYASAKYASVTFANAYNPALAKHFAAQLGTAVTSTVTLAVAATAVFTGAVAATSVPVLGWIAGGLAAVSAAIMALFASFKMVERNRNLRKEISRTVNGMLKSMFRRGNIKDEFSGYLLGILLPNKRPWDDIEDTPYGNLWHNFCLVHAGPGCCWSAPQIPWIYLNYDADFVCSMTVPGQEFLIMRPIVSNGMMTDWKQVILGTKDAKVNLLGNFQLP